MHILKDKCTYITCSTSLHRINMLNLKLKELGKGEGGGG